MGGEQAAGCAVWVCSDGKTYLLVYWSGLVASASSVPPVNTFHSSHPIHPFTHPHIHPPTHASNELPWAPPSSNARQVVVGIVLGVEFSKYNTQTLPSSVAVGVLVVICVFVAGFAWSWGPLG